MTTQIAYSSEDLVRQYIQTSSGHFFNKDTMRFFRSRMTSNYRRLSDTQALFITTEQGPTSDCKRLATVRMATLTEYIRESDGRLCHKITIETVGDFNQMTLARAKTAMNNFEVQS